jgi:transcriptional regulator with XRE-family HTH domain
MGRSTPPLPLAVRRALRDLGANVRDARKRRQLTVALVAERAMISVVTALKVERGDPSASIGAYANVLFVLGLVERLGEIAGIGLDERGQQLAAEVLPQRVRIKRIKGIKQPTRKRDTT